MIKFENTEVMNFEGALRGMRNPLNSWNKSDSGYYFDNPNGWEPIFKIGENDLDLAKRLIKAGSDHRKFLRQILVSVDITAPLYWWKEFDTYKVGTVANSCSTMHKIHDKEFTLDDFSREHIDGEYVCATYSAYGFSSWDILKLTIKALNYYRKMFIKTKEKAKNAVSSAERKRFEEYAKKYWWQMIQLLPTSYNQKRTVTLNYEVLRNIYGSRKGHKLDEWSVGFMEWIESLPYAEELLKEVE